MHLDLLQDPELAAVCVSAAFHLAILHFPKGSQVNFCIVVGWSFVIDLS